VNIIRSLAKIEDVKDFRLKTLMGKLRLDPRQPSTFYRELIKECREAEKAAKELRAQVVQTATENQRLSACIASLQSRLVAANQRSQAMDYWQGQANRLQARVQQLEVENARLRARPVWERAYLEEFRRLQLEARREELSFLKLQKFMQVEQAIRRLVSLGYTREQVLQLTEFGLEELQGLCDKLVVIDLMAQRQRASGLATTLPLPPGRRR